jgi:hypothetical protein
LVPRYAKSAATLLTLGAERIVLGAHAELGPLDAQLLDPEREDYSSTLDEVQALQRLHARALETVDETMNMLLARTGKKVETLLPMVLRFVADLMEPLSQKIDTVHYTQMSRILKVAEEYAVRLLAPKYPLEEAKRIARHLVEAYPEHGFIIDATEANDFGLEVEEAEGELAQLLGRIAAKVSEATIIGRLEPEGTDE